MNVTNQPRLTKIAPNATRKIVSWEHTCQKCGKVWVTENQIPIRCADQVCRSPNWNKDYSNMKK